MGTATGAAVATARTGIVIVSHGHSGQAMLEVARSYVGEIDAISVDVALGEAREVTARRIEEACGRVAADEVLFLVDLEGSTPFNVCRMRSGRAAILSGVNLPMLFKLATVDRARSALELAEELKATGQKSIHIQGQAQGED
jgi:mannose/fructose-specific phosphotransferase system component IIA